MTNLVSEEYKKFLDNYHIVESIDLPDIHLDFVQQSNNSYILTRCDAKRSSTIKNVLHKINSPYIVPVESEHVLRDGTYIHRYVSPVYQSKPFYTLKNFVDDFTKTGNIEEALYPIIIRDLATILLIFHSNNWLFNSFDPNKFYLDDTYGCTHLRYIGFYLTFKFNSKKNKHSYPLIMNDFSDPKLSEIYPPLLSFDIYSFGKFLHYLITGEASLDQLNEINEIYEQNLIYNRYISFIKSCVDNDRPNRYPISRIIRDPIILDRLLHSGKKYRVQIGPNFDRFDHLLKTTVNKSYYGTLELSQIGSYLLYFDSNGVTSDIHIDPECLHNNVFVRCTNTINYIPLTIGMKVVRGPHWKEENADIDGGHVGIVEYINEVNTCQVYVRWNHSRMLMKHNYSDKDNNVNFEVIPAYPPLMIGEQVKSLDGELTGIVVQLKTKRHPLSTIYSESTIIKDYMPTIDWGGGVTNIQCYGEFDEFEVAVFENEYMNPNIRNSIRDKYTLTVSEYQDLLNRYQAAHALNSLPSSGTPSTMSPLGTNIIPTLGCPPNLHRLFTNDPAKDFVFQNTSRSEELYKQLNEVRNMAGSIMEDHSGVFRNTCSYRESIDNLINNYGVGNFITRKDEDEDQYSYGEIKSIGDTPGKILISWNQLSPDYSSHVVKEIVVDINDYVQCTKSNRNKPIIKVGQLVGVENQNGVKVISLDNPMYRVVKITNDQYMPYFMIALEKIDRDVLNESCYMEVSYYPSE